MAQLRRSVTLLFPNRKRFSLCFWHVQVALLAASLLHLSCGSNHEISDVIQPLRLVSGEKHDLKVSNMLYAEAYDLRFRPHPHLTVEYDQRSTTLSVNPDSTFAGFTLLEFGKDGREYVMPVFVRSRQRHQFRLKPETRPETRLSVMGNFNDWNRTNLPMADSDGDGIYERAIDFEPGRYLYQFVLDGREFPDPRNNDREDNGFGGYNSVLIVENKSTGLFLHKLSANLEARPSTCSFALQAEAKLEPVLYAMLDNVALASVEKRVLSDSAGTRIWRFDVYLPHEAAAGERTLRVVAATAAGATSNMQTVFLPSEQEGGRWHWRDAIIYSIMLDRFKDGDPSNNAPIQHDSLAAKVNYLGGDLQGVIDKIEAAYFDSVGANTLWLSPVNENPNQAYREWPPPHRYFSGYHGYWPVDQYRVEEHFGDMKLLKKLVDTAHRHNLKILLDFTANHVHQDHPFFAAHRDWFGTYELADGRKNMRLWDEFRLTTWFEPFLPSFDYEGSDAALEAMTDNAVWWLRETGADGFRHDAVKHIPNRFWERLTRKIRNEIQAAREADVFQIGETFGSYELVSSYVNPGQLNAQFNFNLYDAAISVLLRPKANFEVLRQELERSNSVYGTNHLMGNVMDSHDKVRYMAYADGDLEVNSNAAAEIGWSNPPNVDDPDSYKKAKLYLAYMFTIPGVPVLYYGDEIGLTGAADPDNRRMMRFGQDLSILEQDMLAYVKAITRLRQEHPALRHGDFHTLYADQNIFAFARSDFQERLVILLNKSTSAQISRFALPEFLGLATAIDVQSVESFVAAGREFTVPVSGTGWRVLSLMQRDK